MKVIPVIDVFAGPGGLSEGFSRFESLRFRFDVKLSIEKDAVACATLRLRAFVRQFRGRKLPKAYYTYVRGDARAFHVLKSMPEWQRAEAHVRQWTLGEADPAAVGHVSLGELHDTISSAIGGRRDWLLLGGPPCQAYSVIGRARMTGVGSRFNGRRAAREEEKRRLQEAFAADHRHTLYRQYLQIVAIHQPAAFVMENVKGILSARLPLPEEPDAPPRFEFVLDRIMNDLRDPAEALARDQVATRLKGLRDKHSGAPHRYRLYSFVHPADLHAGECVRKENLIICGERYGVPQTRHRVIILGIRDDVDTLPQLLTPRDRILTVRDFLEDLPKVRSGLSTDASTRRDFGPDGPESWCRAIRAGLPKAILRSLDPRFRSKLEKLVARTSTRLDRGSKFIEDTLPSSGAPRDALAWLQDPQLAGVIQHETRSHMASDLARYLFAAAVASVTRESPKLSAWPAGLLPAHRNIPTETGRGRHHLKRIAFHDRFRVQVWGRPASTITSHIAKDGHYFIHPDAGQCRSLTVREAARLQTFPDNYYFEGGRTEQFIQVGNAVPPFLAHQLAQVVADVLVAFYPAMSEPVVQRRYA